MITFLDLFRQYIKYCRQTNDREKQKRPITLELYIDKYNVVSSFLCDKELVKLKAKDFTEEVAQAYWEWMNPQYSHNYSVRLLEICSRVLDYGVRSKEVNHNPIIYFKKKRLPPKDPPYFSTPQIKLFEKYNSSFPMDQKACDMFVIQIHTGFDYGDFEEFNKDHVVQYKGVVYIVKARHKPPHVKMVIPVSAALANLLEKYHFRICLLSNPKYNKHIKIVAADIGVTLRPKAKDGRKLFMMNKLNNEGYSMEAVSKMGGHKSVRTTETYYAQVNIALIHKEVMEKSF